MFAARFNVIGLEEFADAKRRAWYKAGWVMGKKFAEIEGVETVDVFCGVDRFYNACGLQVKRKGLLDEDAVDCGVLVEVMDEREKVRFGRFFFEMVHIGDDAHFYAPLFLHLHVRVG